MPRTTIEILLTSDFDGSGIDQAEEKVRQMAGSLQGDLFRVADLPNLNLETGNAAAELTLIEEALRQLARAAEGVGELKLAHKLIELSKQAKAVKKDFTDLSKLTSSEIIKKFTSAGSTISEMSKQLANASKEQKKYAEALLLARKTSQAQMHLDNAKAIDAEKAALDRLNNELKETSDFQKNFPKLGEMFGGDEPLKVLKKELGSLKKEMEGITKSKHSSISEALEAGKTLQEIQKLDEALGESKKTMFKWGKDAETLSGVLNSKFNQLGFAMFVTTSSFRNLSMIAKTFGDILRSITESQARWQGFNATLGAAGANINRVTTELMSASGGYVEFSAIQSKITTEMLSGNTAIADYATSLVTASRALEIASGGSLDATETFNSLADAMSEGDVAALESIPGFEGISNELELIAAQQDVVGNAFSDADRSAAALEIIARRISAINEELGDLAGESDKLKEITQDMALLKEATGLGAATFVHEITEGLRQLANGLTDSDRSSREFASDWAIAMGTIGIIIREFVGFLAAVPAGIVNTFKSAALAIDYMKLEIADAIDVTGLFGDKIEEEQTRILAAANALGDTIYEAFLQSTIDSRDAWIELRQDVREQYGFMESDASETANAISNFFQGIKRIGDVADVIGPLSDIKNQLEYILGEEYQLDKDLRKLWDDHVEAMNDVNDKLVEDMIEARDEYHKDLAEIDEKGLKAREDLYEKFADKMIDIDEKLQVKTDRMIEDFNDKAVEEKKKHDKKVEDIEEDHQKKLDDIQRKFELSRLKALIDRDARALFAAEQRRNEELRKANEDADDKQQTEDERFQEAQEKAKESFDKALRRANEDAERARADAKENHQKALDDLEERIKEEAAARLEAIEEELEDLKKAAEKRQKALEKQHSKQVTNRKENYKEMLMMQKAQALLEEVNRIEQFRGSEEQWNDYWGTLIQQAGDFYTEYSNILSKINNLPTPEFDTIFGGGTPGGDGGFPSDDTGGAYRVPRQAHQAQVLHALGQTQTLFTVNQMDHYGVVKMALGYRFLQQGLGQTIHLIHQQPWALAHQDQLWAGEQ